MDSIFNIHLFIISSSTFTFYIINIFIFFIFILKIIEDYFKKAKIIIT